MFSLQLNYKRQKDSPSDQTDTSQNGISSEKKDAPQNEISSEKKDTPQNKTSSEKKDTPQKDTSSDSKVNAQIQISSEPLDVLGKITGHVGLGSVSTAVDTVQKIFKTTKHTSLQPIENTPGFKSIAKKESFSSGSIALKNLGNLLKEIPENIQKKFPHILEEIKLQEWETPFNNAGEDLHFFGDTGNQIEYLISLTPIMRKGEQLIGYRQYSYSADFTIAPDYMKKITTKTNLFREKTTEELVEMPVKLTKEHMKNLIALRTCPVLNRAKSIAFGFDDTDNDEIESQPQKKIKHF